MAARSRLTTTLVALAALAVTASGCGVDAADDASSLVGTTSGGGGTGGDVVGPDISPTPPTAPPSTAPPPVDVEVIGDDGSDLNKVAANAISDIEAWWAIEYPDVYGDAYEPVSGGFFAIDSNTEPAGLPCAPDDIDIVLDNAYYCPPDDGVAWDQEGLFPELAEQYGDFSIAVVLAHEWGHAIQERARVDEPTIVTELQADCFAGAWSRHVRDDAEARFSIDTIDLDLALAALLSLKDAPGSSADDPNAHGSGFDRVGAFQDGFEQSAGRCQEYTVGEPSPYQFEFTDQDDLDNNGDLPYNDPDGPGEQAGIDTAAFDSLELYWADVFPELSGGDDWQPLAEPVAFGPDDPPTCGSQTVADFRLFYCVPDRYVGFDTIETMPEAYQLGDFAVGALFGTQYGLAVADQLGDDAPGEVTTTLRGDCYAGAWAGALLPTEVDPNLTELPYALILSPGDLDEAVAVLLSFRSDTDRERQGPGFNRVSAFRAGVIEGPGACPDLQAPS